MSEFPLYNEIQMDRILLVSMLLCIAALLRIDAFERWHDKWGIATQAPPKGSFRLPAKDINGSHVKVGGCVVVILPECGSCAAKQIKPENILSLAKDSTIIVLAMNNGNDVPPEWRLKHRNVFVFGSEAYSVPGEWLMQAPLRFRAEVRSEKGELKVRTL